MTDKKTDALKLALEALEVATTPLAKDRQEVLRARAAIREALAEQPAQQQSCDSKIGESETQSDLKFAGETQAQQQEPVAWMSAHRFEELRQGFTVMTTLTKQKAFEDDVGIYTSPPASKPWVGLTEEEVDECYYWKGRQWTTDELVRHVEAKLREKNA